MHIRGQPAGRKGRQLILSNPSHHQDLLQDTCPPEFEAFFHDGDREHPRALGREALRHVRGAVAVGVGLDDGHRDAARRQRARDRPVVRRERIEVDDGVSGTEGEGQRPGPSLIIARSEKRVYSPDQPSVKRSVGPLRCLAMMTSPTFFCSVSLS
jgi:hypothetical protein